MDGKVSRIMLVLLLFALSACNGSGSSPPAPENPSGVNPPDAPADPSPVPPPAEEPAEEPPPVNDDPIGHDEDPPLLLVPEEALDPLDPVVLRFSKPIDPESIGNTVILRSLNGEMQLVADAEYDAANLSLTLTPRVPLPEDSHFVIDLYRAAEVGGVSVAGSMKSWHVKEAATASPLPPIIRTRPSLIREYLVWDEESGEVTGYWHYSYHPEGKVWQVIDMFSGPGPDNDWFETTDNERSGIFVTEILDGKSHRRIWYNGAGENGVWDAGEDDEIKSINLYLDSGLPGAESYLSSEGIGDDGEWFTADDDYNVVHLRRFDPASRTLIYAFGNRQVSNLGPGEDGEWFTADDGIAYYQRQLYDRDLRLLKIEKFQGAGIDGEWYGDDDLLVAFTEYEYDETGRVAAIRPYYRPHPDQPDFAASHYRAFSYDGDRAQYEYSVNRDPASGEISSYIRHQRSERGALLKYGVFHGPGPDATWFTADDASANLSENILNETGLADMTWHYEGLGPDGLAYTGDETVGALTKFRYDEKGRKLESGFYTSPGEDETWNTVFDRLSLSFTYYVEPPVN